MYGVAGFVWGAVLGCSREFAQHAARLRNGLRVQAQMRPARAWVSTQVTKPLSRRRERGGGEGAYWYKSVSCLVQRLSTLLFAHCSPFVLHAIPLTPSPARGRGASRDLCRY